MLAISLSRREVRYISWDRFGDEVRLLASQVLPWEESLDGFHNVSMVRDVIRQISEEKEIDSASGIYLTLDADFCNYSLMEVDPTWEAREQLDFGLKRRFGDTPFYESFQYPIESSTGVYLNVDCPIVLRRAISSALSTVSPGDHHLSIGVFSAYQYASKVEPEFALGRRLIWRASSNGRDQLLEINNGEFQALHLLYRDNATIRHIVTVGKSNLKKAIASFVEQLGDGQDALFPEVETVYVYLGSGRSDFLATLLGRQLSTASLLNPFYRWNWPDVPDADNQYEQSAFVELAGTIWEDRNV